MQSSSSIQRTVTSTQSNPTQSADMAQLNAISGLLILLPAVVLCAIAGYRKHQATVRQRRIQRLNRLWQLDSSKNLS